MKFKISLLILICGILSSCNTSTQSPDTIESEREVTEYIPIETISPEPILPLIDKIICVDAGHGLNSSKQQENIAPNSKLTKPAFVSGTKGQVYTEEELNLIIALKLQAKLEENGASVYMTRTTHETSLSNIGRAIYANDLAADISIKIHADGSNDSSVNGISILVPSTEYVDDDICASSKTAGSLILDNIVAQTGAKNRGIISRNDMTGFNWSTVPVILIESGFMTNVQEDALLSTDEYQNKIVQGIVDGVIAYFDSIHTPSE